MPTQKRILVIDDDQVTRELLKAVLEHADYEVIFAEDGLSGVEKASTEKPDLVITDGLLPKLHGFLACKAIKDLQPAPKVILLTGIYTKPTYKWEVKHEYEADDLLTKPVGIAELLACVRKHLGDSPNLIRSEPVPSPTSIEMVAPNEQGVCQQPEDPRAASSLLFSEREMDDMFNAWVIPCA